MDSSKDWRDWNDAMANIDDVATMSQMGTQYYRKFYGGPTPRM